MSAYKFAFPNTPIEWLKQLGIAATYSLVLYIGELFFEGDAIIGHFEPASGLALAVLLLGGKRYVWGIFFGAALIHAISGDPFLQAAIIASSDALEGLVGAWLLTRDGKFDLRLQSLRDYMRLVLLGGGISIALSALLTSTLLLAIGLLAPDGYFHSLLHWWMSDTLGVILVTPLILVWWQEKYNWRGVMPRQLIEAFLLLGLAILVGQMIFFNWLSGVVDSANREYWMFMFVNCVAMFLGVRGTTFILVVVAIQAMFGAIQGTGYFADDIAKSYLVNYWFYMVTLSLVGMTLAIYVNEIKQAKIATAYRDALIREIHHRIKNNLQGITGLLRQLAQSHPETTDSINQTIGQVQSIAAIHGLQERASVGNMQLHELAGAVATGVGSLWQKTIVFESAPDWMPCAVTEAEATPLALILNELLSNAVKHGDRLGQAKIMLSRGLHPDSIRIVICNAGQLPPDFDFEGNTGTGLQLVKSLMPRTGAKLSLHCRDNMVITTLELEPPVITFAPKP